VTRCHRLGARPGTRAILRPGSASGTSRLPSSTREATRRTDRPRATGVCWCAMRPLASIVAVLLLLVALSPGASAQRHARPPAHPVRLGPIAVELFGEGEPQRGPYGDGGERVWHAFAVVTQTLMRGPRTWLPEVG